MMRIVYTANVRFPTIKAHGIQIAKMCEALVAHGVDLTLVVPNKGPTSDAFSFYGLSVNFQIRRLWTLALWPTTRIGFLLSAVTFGLSSFFYLLTHRDHDITYSIDIDHISYLGTLFSDRPCFFEMHAPRTSTLLTRTWFNRVRGLMAINNQVKDTLERDFPVLKGKILITPNGVDFSRYAGLNKMNARQELGLSNTAKIIVYTGSFQGWKGIETIIKAARDLSSWQFYFIGGTEEELRRLGFKDTISGNAHFLGKRDFKEMPLWHTGADILLVTGTKNDEYSYRYTSPMKLFEYMAAQRPIVASRTPAIEQVVTDQEVFFHEPDNPDDLGRVIESVEQNPTQAQERVRRAYTKAHSLSWDERAKRVIKFITQQL